jgi:hypothetical protein
VAQALGGTVEGSYVEEGEEMEREDERGAAKRPGPDEQMRRRGMNCFCRKQTEAEHISFSSLFGKR